MFGRQSFPFTIQPGGGIGLYVGIYAITALLSILGPVQEVLGAVRTRRPERQDTSLGKHFGQPVQVACENLMSGILQFECGTVGTLLFDANSIFTAPERPSLVLHGTLGGAQHG